MAIGSYEDFWRALGQNESGNNYSFVSSLGYLGRFQFGEEALQAVGFYNGDSTSTIDFTGSWTSKAGAFGVWDKSSFLSSPAAQDAATQAWFSKVNDDVTALGLKSYIGQWIGGGPITESGLVAGGHLVGVWALKSFLESGGRIDTPDGYNTPVSEYVRRFGGYDTPFSPGGGVQPPAPSADQVLTAAYPGASLAGGAGSDTLNASQGSDQLAGGAGADTFAFKAMPWSAGRITDFQVGTDRLDLSAIYANGYRGANPVADGYVSFAADGQGGAKVMLDVDGPDGGSTIQYHVVSLEGVAPGGLNAANVFGATTSQPGAPAAGGGQILTSAYPGATLAGGSSADVLNASQGSDRLTGGGGADTFVFKAMPWSAGRITDFQVGTDRLDLSALYANGYGGSDPVADGYIRLIADGVGGTKVMMDVDGFAGGSTIAYHVVTLEGVSPSGLSAAQVLGGGPSAPAAAGEGRVLISDYPGAPLVGGSGADTLQASRGADQLTGGSGRDHFVFGDLPWSAGRITDFQPGADVLDLRPLFAQVGYRGGDPRADGYLRLEDNGHGGTTVLFDSDGWGSSNPWSTTITHLDGVKPAALSSSDWLFN
ncbi:MAG: type I secretion C-terminal target domain-containing protein [Phenylobacterium sp.]|uniref:type I secretion C-terminal target domain-containing protein n=1 Tax=Phenylobacterium sp. TaxID=1871053 RepID=UPI00271C581F|nr:type I secretion C-terminal target domain-containing protein [Phenylobacterium sp.]MDO8911433.1 type I secretion C-terminal target domain-containing protein [Phenylobacterium sp.]MDP3098893.1 type I secretion C-terminal target domain-containing protein [Phenylobacterium sp.]